MPEPLIIIGTSARAAAQSAIRAGFAPWCVDLFADRDLLAVAPVKRCPATRYPEAIPELLGDAPHAPVLLAGAMENHPAVIEAIAALRPLTGAAPAAMALARDPGTLATMAAVPGLGVCAIRRTAPTFAALTRLLRPNAVSKTWLLKPLRGAGGRGVRFWRAADRMDAAHYLQQFIPGRPISAVYAADGWTCRLMGVTEQIIGDEGFGAAGFQYAGTLGPLELGTAPRQALMRLGVALTQRCDLRGVFGVDAVINPQGVIWPVEVNPRYTASVEILEAAGGLPVLRPDAASLPPILPNPAALTLGKAIVFARTECTVPDLYADFPRAEIADVPVAGERVPAGRPVCTVFASATDRDACLTRLRDAAERVYTRFAP